MASILKFLLITLLSLSLVKCENVIIENSVNGVGEVIQHEIYYEATTHFVFERGWNIVMIPSNENKIFIEANENLINDELIIEDQLGKLTISAERNIRKADKKLIQVYYTERLTNIDVNSGAFVLSNETLASEIKLSLNVSSGARLDLIVNSENIAASSSSGASLELKGQTGIFNATSSSGAAVKAEALKTYEANLSASSGASIEVEVEGKANANASSGASIKINGEPAEVNKTTSSGGSVKLR